VALALVWPWGNTALASALWDGVLALKPVALLTSLPSTCKSLKDVLDLERLIFVLVLVGPVLVINNDIYSFNNSNTGIPLVCRSLFVLRKLLAKNNAHHAEAFCLQTTVLLMQ